jgi:hypothetical protein
VWESFLHNLFSPWVICLQPERQVYRVAYANAVPRGFLDLTSSVSNSCEYNTLRLRSKMGVAGQLENESGGGCEAMVVVLGGTSFPS